MSVGTGQMGFPPETNTLELGLASPLRGWEELRDPAELPCPRPQHRHHQHLLRFG